jgi:predicted acylesterase/phospholipase RssA
MGKRLYNQGIARLVRHLCDVKIGLALGGGGARGLAHFGVLRALDRAGISFDIMSGTSAGSMFGLSYAAGLEVDFMIQTYSLDLRPPRLFRRLPGGDRLFLIWKFRTRGWDKMLRPYFHDWTMEQLQTPFVSVAVDLVSGNPVVTETGDIISAMLESLNLPGVAQPILKDGRALVDGGVLNNLPGDVLVERNADYVVGVNVGAELSQKFGVNRPGMKTEEMKIPGNLETLFRVLEVVGKGTAELKRSSIDLQIQPDMSRASFSDFTQGAALAEIGEAAAEASLPELQASLLELTRFKPA